MPRSFANRVCVCAAAAILLAGCDGRDMSPQERVGPAPGPVNKFDPEADSVFGSGGFSTNALTDGSLFGGDAADGPGTPVNRYLWQASLDTISFMPLASTDPFTGVIATDWSSTEAAPGERFKVTVYHTSPELAATSVKVAVYRQVRDEKGDWIQTAVDPETPRKLEDAILTRARQMRVAEAGDEEAS